MKRDMDLVRLVLLRIESLEIPPGAFDLIDRWRPEFQIECYDADTIWHHISVLIDGGFVQSKPIDMAGCFQMRGLTWKGHEFLDSIRDPVIWKATKEGVSEAGGFSVDLLSALAKGLIKKQIEKHTGISLEF